MATCLDSRSGVGRKDGSRQVRGAVVLPCEGGNHSRFSRKDQRTLWIYGLKLNRGWCTAFENVGQLESLHIDFGDITVEELRRLQESLPKTRVTAPAPQSNEQQEQQEAVEGASKS